ncbi:hypothetical protein VC83_04107 [Pseudogymnoascus destructans]|uniref:Chromo domain-containing protein n=1 Tax=Pseudogymnoascus destructans TaxID=655981 RepID=A0A177ADE7_9PEZI|nr:uncharacterized protein VC83_04107 [Pseudogymnoascus destructans]OAF59301.1 hypothetical protein VC83_04107 [Pseudogymnoascus destructans]
MATVNMNCIEFYNPNPKRTFKASQVQPTKSVLNNHRQPLQPNRSPSATLAGDVQDNHSLDDSLPSLEELLRPLQNGDIPRVPHQNHKPLHISKRQLNDEGHLLTGATTPNSAYVPGNTQREPLIIEDDSDDESDDEAEAGAAWSDLQPQLLASIEDQDASECGLATQDTASTASSLFDPSTPRDSDYLSADGFSKDGQQLPSFAELDSKFPVHVRRPSPNCSELAETTGHDQIHQDVEKAIVDEMRPSPLRERACGSCDRGYVCDIEDELQQTSAEAGGPLRSSAAHSQYNQMDQESQNNTDVRGTSREERLWEETIEQQHCQQNEQEDEQEDNTEATSSEDKRPISYYQQTKDSPQHQQLEDKTIIATPLSQDREHSIKSYRKDNEDTEDNEDDEDDEDVRPPRRRKRRRRESDAIETATLKKVHTRLFTVAQAQTCTTRGSTVSRSSPDDAESALGADYQEYPLQGFLKRIRSGHQSVSTYQIAHLAGNQLEDQRIHGFAHPMQRGRGQLCRSRESDRLCENELRTDLLKEKDKLPWDEIAEFFPGRSKGTLQVRYSTKLKNRSQTSKYKKGKGVCSSAFSTDLVDPQLRDALPSTSSLAATADFITGPHRDILSTGNKEHTTLQLRCGSQGMESDTDEICDVEVLLAKLTVRNVVWYLVKWEGFGDDENTWQEQGDISLDLVDNFEASYQGNFGVELLKKRERRGKIKYFVKWKGHPAGENSCVMVGAPDMRI